MTASTDLTGRTLGDFQLRRRLGQGGMGQVYLAWQLTLKRPVAVKILRTDLAANQTALQRFQAEAQAVAQLAHANIVQVYAIGEENGLHYMALEYVEGRNLREYLERKGPPALPAALSIMRQVAAALQRAGEAGFVHRDIKPENILLTRKGEAKVADFGLARYFADADSLRITQDGVTLGTPLYMSPEQVQGQVVDPRSDLYSLGVTCYHLVAGEPPFRGQTAFEVALHHVQRQPPPLEEVRPDLPRFLCQLVHKLMAKSPDRRYQTAREVLHDLNRLREEITIGGDGANLEPILFRADTPVESVGLAAASETRALPRRTQRPWMRWGTLAGSIVLAAALGMLAARWMAPQPLSPTAQAADVARVNRAANPQVESPQEGKGGSRRLADGRIELGRMMTLIRQGRSNEAVNRAQTWVDTNPPRSLRARLGELVLGLVAAEQDQAEQAIVHFEKVLLSNPRQLMSGLLRDRDLAFAVAAALRRTRANLEAAGKPFPAELERWIDPPFPTWPRAKGRSRS